MTSSTALLTDHYELTMLRAALESGRGDAARRCSRCSPARCRTAGATGSSPAPAASSTRCREFRFGPDEIAALREHRGGRRRAPRTWLRRTTGSRLDQRGSRRARRYFPDTPVLVVEGSFAECVLLETLVLSILNHDSAIASAAARMTCAAGDRPCVEMGSRRTHEQAAVAAARAAYIAGFAAHVEPRGRAALRHPHLGDQRARVHPRPRGREDGVRGAGRLARARHHAARRHLRRAGGRAYRRRGRRAGARRRPHRQR